MVFNDNFRDGDYTPDFDLLTHFADEMLVELKQRILVNKLLKVQDDF